MEDNIKDVRRVVKRLDKFAPVMAEVVAEVWKEYKDDIRVGGCSWDSNGWAIGCWRELLQDKIEKIGEGIRAYDKDKQLDFTRIENAEYKNLVEFCLIVCFGLYHCKDLGVFRQQELLKMFSKPDTKLKSKG